MAPDAPASVGHLHPQLDRLTTTPAHCHSLFSEDGRQRLLWFTAPPGTEGAAQLELLSVIGTQDMTTSADEFGRRRG